MNHLVKETAEYTDKSMFLEKLFELKHLQENIQKTNTQIKKQEEKIKNIIDKYCYTPMYEMKILDSLKTKLFKLKQKYRKLCQQ